MARFDVYRTPTDSIVVDCQADVLAHLRTRFVVPLLSEELEPKVADRLNPIFEIEGGRYVLYPQFAAAMRVQDLKQHVTSLGHQQEQIMGALDMLISGF
jgi:toxin CcdB